MIDINEMVRGQMARDLDTKIRQQRGRDRQTIVMEVYKIASEEETVREKLSKAKIFSDKWWHLLNQANILRNDLIAGFEMTDRIDPSLSRNLLFGRGC